MQLTTTRIELPRWPAWVDALFGSRQVAVEHGSDLNPASHSGQANGWSYFEVEHKGLGAADEQAFYAACSAAYARIGDWIAREPNRQPVRFWNFVPRIQTRNADGLDRYMRFNEARFEACARWYGDGAFGRTLAAASAVDARGDALVVQLLCRDRPGVPVENPRQTAAWQYSHRYGPRPPCFARATWLPTPGELLISGTASVVGEDSLHPGDLEAQLAETFDNFDALLAAAPAAVRLREARAYVMHAEDQACVAERVAQRFQHLEYLEIAAADLCRSDLLVEIEAVASAVESADLGASR